MGYEPLYYARNIYLYFWMYLIKQLNNYLTRTGWISDDYALRGPYLSNHIQRGLVE